MSDGGGHAIERARERLGIELTKMDLKRMADRCAAQGPGVVVVRAARGEDVTAVLVVDWKGWAIPLLYDTRRNWIVTVLPRQWRKRHQRREKARNWRQQEKRRRKSARPLTL